MDGRIAATTRARASLRHPKPSAPFRRADRRFALHRLPMLLVLGAVALAPSCRAPVISAGQASPPARCGVWKTVRPPVPAGRSGILKAVTSVSRRDAWAVGSFVGSTLAEHWNGRVWRIVPTPNRRTSALLAVTAISASDVWAVGWRIVGGLLNRDTQPLIEDWNGVAWHRVPGPRLYAGSELRGVSGISADDVWAVGYKSDGDNGRGTLVEHWNGSAWSVVRAAPNRAFGLQELNSVVAVSQRNVWAVGDREDLDFTVPLIEHWDGHVWSIVHGPPGDRRRPARLEAVAASSASNVWAVGRRGRRSQPMAERWNGRRWTRVPTARIGEEIPPHSELHSLAVSSHGVWAVGETSGAGHRDPRRLIEHWDGRRWRVFWGLRPGPRQNRLFGVVEISPREVWAVGTSGTIQRSKNLATGKGGTLVGRWNGRTWKAVRSRDPATRSGNLDAVDFVNPSDVWAAGQRLGRGYVRGLVEHWDGARWTAVATPAVARRNVYLKAIKAFGSKDVWAVGWTVAPSNTHPRRLLDHWNGHRWAIVPGANGAPFGSLSAISAVSPNNVWVAGDEESARAQQPFIERWNGSNWTRRPGPPRMHRARALVAISARDVWVASGNGERLDHWNGARWVSFSINGPESNHRVRKVFALAASSSRDVWGAGHISTGKDNPFLTLAEQWNGTSWRVRPTLNPGGDPPFDRFSSIAVFSPSNVWAAGTFLGDKLVEHWNGKRFKVVLPPMTIADRTLFGVDGSPSEVWVVGRLQGYQRQAPLAERYVPCEQR